VLIDAKADVDTDGARALAFAKRYKHHKIVALLEAAGCLTMTEHANMGPFLVAVEKGQLGEVKMMMPIIKLLKQDVFTLMCQQGLIIASDRGHRDIVRYLLDCGVRDPVVPQDKTSLMRASGAGHVDVVKDLLDAGFDIHAKSSEGQTALQIAAQRKHRDVVAVLLARINELKKASSEQNK
jgi:serine/threonine-protein phosphatase 6 regulatory ankyrin repeat subunit B